MKINCTGQIPLKVKLDSRHIEDKHVDDWFPTLKWLLSSKSKGRESTDLFLLPRSSASYRIFFKLISQLKQMLYNLIFNNFY